MKASSLAPASAINFNLCGLAELARAKGGLVSLLSFEPGRNADHTTTSGNKQKPQNSTAHFTLPRDRLTENVETRSDVATGSR